MRTIRFLLKLLHERFPCPEDGARHNVVFQDGTLRVYVFVGGDAEGATFWQSINIDESDYDRNATELFREIAPLIETAKREAAIKKTAPQGHVMGRTGTMTNEERARKFVSENETNEEDAVVAALAAEFDAIERESFAAGFKRGTAEGPAARTSTGVLLGRHSDYGDEVG